MENIPFRSNEEEDRQLFGNLFPKGLTAPSFYDTLSRISTDTTPNDLKNQKGSVFINQNH